MKAHLKYLSYVLRHKWYVFIACCRMGIVWQGITHDLSKFLPSEWFPYANYFYANPSKPKRNETGYYKPYDTGDESFDLAWLKHQKRNPHHWHYWTSPKGNGGIKLFSMPIRYRKEMIADWIGAGRAQGKPDTRAWYEANKDKMQLHEDTRAWVEQVLHEEGGGSDG